METQVKRKLASIQRITNIEPVKNSDNLVKLSVLGWRVVELKNVFNIGDLCVYFEIDSILPPLPEFDFLKANNYKLKTVRLRGQLSQGLCVPLKILPPDLEVTEGMDVTDILGVTKFEKPISDAMKGKSKGFHPTIISKSAQTRLQAMPQLLEEFQGKRVAKTVKIEGTSATYINDNGTLHVCSHTHSMVEQSNSIYWQMERKYKLLNILEKIGHYSIQGEIAGPGIEKNPLDLKELEFFVYKVFNNDTQTPFSPEELIAFCEQHGLKHVPMELNILFDFENVEAVLTWAEGFYDSGVPQEGIVIVPMEPCYSEVLSGYLSMKVINNVYLSGEWKKKRKQMKKEPIS